MLATLLCSSMAVLAQTNTNSAIPPMAPLPQGTDQFWDLAIAAVAPIIVWLVAKIVPRVPRVVLPSITPLVGIGLGLLLNKLAGSHLGWMDMAKAGALAVFVREVTNQAITKQMNPDPVAVIPSVPPKAPTV